MSIKSSYDDVHIAENTVTLVDPCDPNPCANDSAATCLSNLDGGYVCDCPDACYRSTAWNDATKRCELSTGGRLNWTKKLGLHDCTSLKLCSDFS